MKLRVLAVISVCCALAAISLRRQTNAHELANATAMRTNAVRTPVEHRRGEDQTFLTYPEWYLVYSPQEYADFVSYRQPSAFPFLDHIGQFWQSYRALYNTTANRYPFNGEYHVMNMVIGVSTTVEYGMKWSYETVVGRLFETARDDQSAEDQLAAEVAHDYVALLNEEPWYKFDYLGRLRQVWTSTGWWGRHPFRKWERKYFLTTEYNAKAAYAWLIRKSSESAYGLISTSTYVVATGWPSDTSATLPNIKLVNRFEDGSALLELRRYQAFTEDAQALAAAGATFQEIAGNRGSILISAVVPQDFEDGQLDLLLSQPISTRPDEKRILLTVPVTELATLIRKFATNRIAIEHIYDY